MSIKATTLRALVWIKNYFYGFMMSAIVSLLSKNIAGSYRPHFIALCKPTVNCTKNQYIGFGFSCENNSSDILLESRMSFVSGHAVVSVYCTGFLMWYLHVRLTKQPLLLLSVNTILLSWLFVCSVTRVTDNFHHTENVFAGILIALPFTVYTSACLCKNFKVKKGSYEMY